ncbi:hypothetical protein PR048_011866 [Dryococelus australis]|uniref:Uncharacterized protein n=1 Tax=Dryococelus australis TaxID=614101 RepID=A0ABQ9HP32_9NEOP|nr:hypothetical protein PR048_011866 [Dryococelus australis]
MDVLEAIKLAEATLASLREQRYKGTDTFKKIFKESSKLAMEMGTQINKPRTTNLQKNISNFNSQTVEEYCRTAVYLPFMDISKMRASKSWTFSKAAVTRCKTIQERFTLFSSFEMRITSFEADMDIRPFTKVPKVSCGSLQTGFCNTKHYRSV